ncbi:acyltransferase domain-containing protein [Nonomuraea typhae]|uniref:acyltransferase domain-containing protein n=1 Tax=Nonomuraea typhae TaxID=2603600 RepID=UPI0015E1CB8B|nr:acyltransferase domain-containing protein [Nonomuraea typhae]
MDVKNLLREHPAWLAHLESLGSIEARFPADPMTELMRLTVPHEDVAGVLASVPEPGTSHRWLLERCVHSLVSTMGGFDRPPAFPYVPELGPYFFVHAFMAALPYTRDYHREHGVPEDVSQATFADLGRNMAVHRKRHGTAGLHAPFWFMLHTRGLLYQLGRLQFERARLGQTTLRRAVEDGAPVGPEGLAVAVHIPDFHGPVTPAACTDSFERARVFFPKHFPEEDLRVATCHSWMLDDQLGRHLPATSNILAFQRRFRLLHRFDDSGMMEFVFGADAKADPLPRRTSLERAIGDHLAAGGTWYGTAGWLAL